MLKMASKDKLVLDYLKANYLNEGYGVNDLYEEAKEDLKRLMSRPYIGRSLELRATKMLSACGKHITQFANATRDKTMEANLLILLLDYIFNSDYGDLLYQLRQPTEIIGFQTFDHRNKKTTS